MHVAALCLELVFLALALGWRALLQYRRTGDWGLRPPATPAARLASTLMILGFLAGGLAPGLELLDLGVGTLDGGEAVRVAGLVVLALAIVGTVHAQLGLGASWRVGVDPDETLALVTTGPYAVVRNPIFTWMLTASFGAALAVPNTLAALGAVSVVAGVELQVRRVEEPYLHHLHGPTYRAYASRVGRFLPLLGRLPPLPS